MINGAAMNIELYGIESQILKLLSESEGNILDNTTLIETLAEAKVRKFSSVSLFSLHVARDPLRNSSLPFANFRGSLCLWLRRSHLRPNWSRETICVCERLGCELDGTAASIGATNSI